MILTSEISETCYGIYEFWLCTNRTKDIKRKLRNRYFLSEALAYREKADTKGPYCLQCEFVAPSLLNGTCESCATRPRSPEVFKKTCFSASVFLSEVMFFRKIFAEHREYFPEKILAPPEVAPWIFPLSCCPSLHARQ